jgi:isopentenyl diphosphate isomerase/L-lactate dehydrogenase-like FMN-dependent dehydrogenase
LNVALYTGHGVAFSPWLTGAPVEAWIDQNYFRCLRQISLAPSGKLSSPDANKARLSGSGMAVAGPMFLSFFVRTMSLVPQVVDAVKVPVIPSGGIMDGRGHRRQPQ